MEKLKTGLRTKLLLDYRKSLCGLHVCTSTLEACAVNNGIRNQMTLGKHLQPSRWVSNSSASSSLGSYDIRMTIGGANVIVHRCVPPKLTIQGAFPSPFFLKSKPNLSGTTRLESSLWISYVVSKWAVSVSRTVNEAILSKHQADISSTCSTNNNLGYPNCKLTLTSNFGPIERKAIHSNQR